MTRYTLPELPYHYAALEPHLSARIVELHHDRHHKAYVDAANRALEQLTEARERGDATRVGDLERALAFNVSGHVLHSLFWRNLTAHGGGRPDGELAAAIDRDFGGFAGLRSELNAAAATISGSGWGALVYEPLSGRLATAQFHDHQSGVLQGSVPLLVVDAWEHAYYLQYENEKKRYFEALWQLWNWPDVAARYAAARRLDLALGGVGAQPAAVPAGAAPAKAPQGPPPQPGLRSDTPARGRA